MQTKLSFWPFLSPSSLQSAHILSQNTVSLMSMTETHLPSITPFKFANSISEKTFAVTSTTPNSLPITSPKSMAPSQQLRVVAIYAPSTLRDYGASMPALPAKLISSKLVKTTIGTPIHNDLAIRYSPKKQTWPYKQVLLAPFIKVVNGFLLLAQ